jgi:membrane-bound lytic murein transglycosylase B
MAIKKWCLLGLLCWALPSWAGSYTQHPLTLAFIDKMVAQHQFDRAALLALFSQAEKKQGILDAIAKPAEKAKPWFEYRKIFLTDERIAQGVQFWQENQDTLRQVESQYAVPAKMIVAIIGVETGYGRNMGRHRVIDALSTLAFDYPPRSEFFTKELEAFLVLTRKEQKSPLQLLGSYAGAMGYGQFMPSSVRNFAVDFDGDGVVDIWQNKRDAIASVANYFKQSGWQYQAPVFVRAKKSTDYPESQMSSKAKPNKPLRDLIRQGFVPLNGDYPGQLLAEPLSYTVESGFEYWLGFNNFYVITRYNRSHMYALAAWQLGEAIEAARKSRQ